MESIEEINQKLIVVKQSMIYGTEALTRARTNLTRKLLPDYIVTKVYAGMLKAEEEMTRLYNEYENLLLKKRRLENGR